MLELGTRAGKLVMVVGTDTSAGVAWWDVSTWPRLLTRRFAVPVGFDACAWSEAHHPGPHADTDRRPDASADHRPDASADPGPHADTDRRPDASADRRADVLCCHASHLP